MNVDFFKIHVVLSTVTIFFYFMLSLGGFDFRDAVSFLSFDFENAVYKYFSAVIALGLGSYLVKYLQDNKISGYVGVNSSKTTKTNEDIYLIGLMASLVLIVIVGVIYNTELLLRYNYQLIEEAGAGLWLSLAETGVGFAPMLCRIYSSDNLINKLSRRMLLLVSIGFLYTIGTKYSVACLLFYVAASYYKNNKLNFGCYLGLLLSMPLLSLILNQRVIGVYGLYSLELTLLNLYYSPLAVVGFGVEVVVSPIFILSETFHRANLSAADLLTELNPLPGKYTNWYSIYHYHRINQNIPFSAIGTLYYYSWFSLLVFGGVLQYVTSLIGIMMRFINSNFAGTITVVFSIYFWAMINAYNLRSIMRWVYLILLIYLIYKLLVKTKTQYL